MLFRFAELWTVSEKLKKTRLIKPTFCIVRFAISSCFFVNDECQPIEDERNLPLFRDFHKFCTNSNFQEWCWILIQKFEAVSDSEEYKHCLKRYNRVQSFTVHDERVQTYWKLFMLVWSLKKKDITQNKYFFLSPNDVAWKMLRGRRATNRRRIFLC